MSEHRTDPLIGAVVDGRYEVRARLARGGMSTVYRALDGRLDREVALKVLYPHLAEDPKLVARFEQEAKTAARLSHPHVVNVLDQGVDHGPDGEIAYLAMEYVPGYTLRSVLRRHGALTPRLALAYLDAIVDGLAAAHDAGLVHRDMKPENVLVSHDGRIKVADFGLARAATHHTGTGATLLGTVAYISPELVQGAPADERSDVYAVGIMLYEMLTGTQPYKGSSPIQVAYQHINAQVPAPSEAVPGLAEDLDELVLWCTAPDPQDRPADARALLTEMRQVKMTLSDEDLDFEGALPEQQSDQQSEHPPEDHLPDDGPTDAHATVALGSWDDPDDLDDPTDDGVDDWDDWDDKDTDGATEVIAARGTHGSHATDGTHPTVAFGPEDTTVIPRGPERSPVVPANTLEPTTQEPATPERTTQEPAPGGRLIPTAPERTQKQLSARAQRRQDARQARTPTEDLGRTNPRRWWIWGAVLLILAGLLALLGWYFGSAGPGGLVTVPDVDGHSRIAAVQELEALGVGYAVTTAHHDLIARDSVISTAPAQGTEVRRYETVTLTVSDGPELFAVPALEGLDRQSADEELSSVELRLGEVTTEYSDTVEQGLVMRQDPAPGTELRRNHQVTLVISDGPEPVAVPELTGLSVDAARAAVEEVGLELEVTGSEHSTEVEAGQILTQDPAEGQLAPGETVRVTESLGPQQVQVPDVLDLEIDEAVRLLEDAGFQVDQTTVLGDLFGDGTGRVRSQNPDAGTEIDEGSTVHLLVF